MNKLSYKNNVEHIEIHEANTLSQNIFFEETCDDQALLEMLPLLSANLAIALQTDQATERFTPQSYKQAVECEDCEEWIKAMMREINAHLDGQWYHHNP